jgi:hypothetical protein
MAKFTDAQWNDVNNLLESNPEKYGLPEKRNDSVVLASFNIRKLGKVESKTKQSWEFLKRFCECCDLISIQEVQDNLEGLNYLKGLLGDDYGMVASDVTGKVPGKTGMAERLAFLFNWKRVNRTEIASDITYDRKSVLDSLYKNKDDFWNEFKKYAKDVKKYVKYKKDYQDWKNSGEVGEKPSSVKKPNIAVPHFLTFIRTPLCVSFRIPGFDGSIPYEFLAINAHLLYGDSQQEREDEFWALMEWILARAKQADNLYHKNIFLFGDLNLDFKEVDNRRNLIEQRIKDFNKAVLTSKKSAKVNFPFLDVHPDSPNNDVFRTNARQDQTYDQIALFMHDKRLPVDACNDTAGSDPGEFDFGMFNFVNLFSEALHGNTYNGLTKDQKKKLHKKFEHDVSDHMPIWIRLPKPYVGQPEL